MTTASKLAIHGGPKVRDRRMPARVAFGAGERAAVDQVFAHYDSTGFDYGYQGFFEKRYTDAFVAYQGGEGYADSVATGTVAVFVALAALQLPAGSKVLVSPITDPGTLTAIIMNRLTPMMLDSAPCSYNVGVRQLEGRLTKDVRAIMLVHSTGQPAPVDAMADIAHDRSVLLVEDCSQAHGATIAGRKVGTFGDIAAFSTMYRKAHASGACGGIVYTKSELLYRLGRAYADRGKPFWISGFDDKDPSQFLFPALNLHNDELSCAIGESSLARLDDTISRRKSFLVKLHQALSERQHACCPSLVEEGDSPFVHPIYLNSERVTCTKLEFAEAVRAEGIDLNPHYRYLVREWPWISQYLADTFECPNATLARDSSFCLLFNEQYGQAEADDIAEAIAKVSRVFWR